VFVQYVIELLKPLGDVTAKAMFGCFGGYRRGVMVALIANETLYLKANDINSQDLRCRSLNPAGIRKRTRCLPGLITKPPMRQWKSQSYCASGSKAPMQLRSEEQRKRRQNRFNNQEIGFNQFRQEGSLTCQ